MNFNQSISWIVLSMISKKFFSRIPYPDRRSVAGQGHRVVLFIQNEFNALIKGYFALNLAVKALSIIQIKSHFFTK